MDSPTAAGSAPPGAPPNQFGGPVFVGSERLIINYELTPPSDLRGIFSDGIEYYCCVNKECKAAWAVQWTPTPRRKRISGTHTSASYRMIAIPKICKRCKQTIKNADEELTQRYEAYKVKMGTEERLKPAEANAKMMEEQSNAAEKVPDLKLDDERQVRTLEENSGFGPFVRNPIMTMISPKYLSKASCSQAAVMANKFAKLQASSTAKHDAAPSVVDIDQQDVATNATANSLARHQAMQKRRERQVTAAMPGDLIEVPLTPPPPPPVIEDPAMLAAEDPTWDVISDDDANEEWAVINHFGSAAREHRDAHVDTPLVRP